MALGDHMVHEMECRVPTCKAGASTFTSLAHLLAMLCHGWQEEQIGSGGNWGILDHGLSFLLSTGSTSPLLSLYPTEDAAQPKSHFQPTVGLTLAN